MTALMRWLADAARRVWEAAAMPDDGSTLRLYPADPQPRGIDICRCCGRQRLDCENDWVMRPSPALNCWLPFCPYCADHSPMTD